MKMIAILKSDGEAILLMNDKFYQLRYPYHSNNLIEYSMEDAVKIIYHGGFELCEYTFDTLDNVISYITELHVEYMKEKYKVK
jgi:hypothetical protein